MEYSESVEMLRSQKSQEWVVYMCLWMYLIQRTGFSMPYAPPTAIFGNLPSGLVTWRLFDLLTDLWATEILQRLQHMQAAEIQQSFRPVPKAMAIYF